MEKHQDLLVSAAVSGDKEALQQIILDVKDLVYNLSLKMLLFPEEAQDATQEILIKVVTHLSTFQGESHLRTWVYRIATNYLLSEQRKKANTFTHSFETYGEQIDSGQSDQVKHARNEGELKLLEEEVKVSCTHGLLMCLNQRSRAIYILGDILSMKSDEGAFILDMTSVNFRKELSRARSKVRNFLDAKCGLANPQNPCRCKRKIDFLADAQIINPEQLRFAQHTNRSIELTEQIESLDKAMAIFQSTPNLPLPSPILKELKETIDTILFQ